VGGAITQSRLDAHGNKAKAAKALGMSQATIYRKIHEFGIVTSAARMGALPQSE
jgi:transcriptional regulator of acetoin/glycerol metabolism